jgi:hypothetical protein
MLVVVAQEAVYLMSWQGFCQDTVHIVRRWVACDSTATRGVAEKNLGEPVRAYIANEVPFRGR